MEREDPLERIDRERREKREGSSLQKTMYILAAVAAALFIALIVVWVQKSSLVKDLQIDKQELTEQIVSLQGDYESLSSEYDTINSQLDSSREEVAQLVERIKKTDATNRAKMRQYEKELGTLRSIMRNYIVQIDSLNTLNEKLTREAASARRRAAASDAKNKELTAQVADLTDQVTAGSIIKASGIKLEAYSGDRVTDNSRRVERMMLTLTMTANEIAKRGPVRVYVRLFNPEGTLLQDGKGTTFEFDGETLEATASREFDYQGSEIEVSIYINNIPSWSKGVYTAKVFTVQSEMGEAETYLR